MPCEALRRLDAFGVEIPHLYFKSVMDYRGRLVTAESVGRYLQQEKNRFAEIAHFLPQKPRLDARLLDIGIAYGFLAVLLQENKGWKCEGLELPENIPVYCTFASTHKIAVHPGKLGIKPLPLVDSSFDAIVFSEVLEHLRISPSLVFAELRRLLMPGGFLLLTTPNLARFTNIAKLWVGRNILEPFPKGIESENITEHLTHIREYTMQEVVDLLKNNGFRIRQAHFSSCMEKQRLHHWLTAWVPPWRGSLMVLAEKVS